MMGICLLRCHPDIHVLDRLVDFFALECVVSTDRSAVCSISAHATARKFCECWHTRQIVIEYQHLTSVAVIMEDRWTTVEGCWSCRLVFDKWDEAGDIGGLAQNFHVARLLPKKDGYFLGALDGLSGCCTMKPNCFA